MKLHDRMRIPAWWLACMAVLGCNAASNPKLATPPPAKVTVSHPIVEEVADYDEYTGRVEPLETVDIRPRVSGYLVKKNFVDGARVKEGDVLFVIDPRPYRADMELELAKVDRAKAELALATVELERSIKLRATKSVSQEDIDKAQAQRDTASASQALTIAAAQKTKLFLEWTEVKAPISGIVSKSYIDIGNLVSSDVVSTKLATIVRDDLVHVYFDVDERSLQRYREQSRAGQTRTSGKEHIKDARIPVRVGLASEEDFPHEGVIDYVDPQVDPQTGTIRVRAVFANPDQQLAAGYFARVRASAAAPRPVLLVSDRTVGSLQSERYVLTVNEKNVVERKLVTMGRRHAGLRVVEPAAGNPLVKTDRVIVEGLLQVRPGETVDPTLEPMPRLAKLPITGTSSPPAEKPAEVEMKSAPSKPAAAAGEAPSE